MDGDALFERGLKVRKKVQGAQHAEASFKKVDDSRRGLPGHVQPAIDVDRLARRVASVGAAQQPR